MKAICPATLDVLTMILSGMDQTGISTEHKDDMVELKDLVLECFVRVVHVIHCSSPDQVNIEKKIIFKFKMKKCFGTLEFSFLM